MKDYIQELILTVFEENNFFGKDMVMFDINDKGANLFVVHKYPRADEILQFWSNNPVEVRITEFKDVAFLSFKIGALNWMDTPYSIHLCKYLNSPVREVCGETLEINIWHVEANTGLIIGNRTVTASSRFTKDFYKIIDRQLEWKDFNREVYDEKITEVYMKYSIKQLKDLSSVYFRA